MPFRSRRPPWEKFIRPMFSSRMRIFSIVVDGGALKVSVEGDAVCASTYFSLIHTWAARSRTSGISRVALPVIERGTSPIVNDETVVAFRTKRFDAVFSVALLIVRDVSTSRLSNTEACDWTRNRARRSGKKAAHSATPPPPADDLKTC